MLSKKLFRSVERFLRWRRKLTTQVAEKAAGPAIHLTEHAAKKIIALLAKEGVSAESGGLRVGMQGGGCSGLSYAMRLDTQSRDRDKVFEEYGARHFCGPKEPVVPQWHYT